MAIRKVTFREWLAGVITSRQNHYMVAEAASRLRVDRSRVHQLLKSGALDGFEITTATGTVAMTVITEASLERYLADRVPDRNRQGYFAFATE
jgi:hypothetical protein